MFLRLPLAALALLAVSACATAARTGPTPELDQPYDVVIENGRVVDVWVNGTLVWREGAHTGAKPGRVVRGPGYGKQLGGVAN